MLKAAIIIGREKIEVSEFELDLIDVRLAAASGARIDVISAEEAGDERLAY